MRIQHNIMAMNANRNLNFNNTQLGKNLEKLSSGYRINRAGDDAAGLAISEKMRADVAIYDQSIRNANDGIALVQTAEGAMTEIHSMLNRMETLATQAANGTYDETDDVAGAIDKEVTELAKEITRITTTTKFNGKTLFGGDDVNIQLGEGDDNTVTIATTGYTVNSLAMASSTGFTSNDGAKTAIETIKDDIKTLSGWRAELGALQNRFEHTVNNLGVTMENLQNSESTIRDTNVADEMMKYTKNNILIQSAQAMLAQANQVPQGVLQLMQ